MSPQRKPKIPQHHKNMPVLRHETLDIKPSKVNLYPSIKGHFQQGRRSIEEYEEKLKIMD